MAMDTAGMKSSIKTEMASRGFDIDNPKTEGQADRYIEAISAGIVKYIQSNAQTNDLGTDPNPAGLWNIL